VVYARFSALIPRPITEAFKKELHYNRIDISEHRFVGFIFIYALFLGIGIGANASLFLGYPFPIIFLLTFFAFVLVVYLILRLSSEGKGKFVESILPDALRLIASNMKSGLTTERAFFVAGRPEFGALQLELRDASKRIASGEKMEVALKGMSANINSRTLEKTIWLISQGIRSGGQIADLLFQLSDDLKDQQSLQEEINSNISIYILLILFATLFGAPVLFGVSSFIVQVLTSQIALVPSFAPGTISSSGGLGIVSGFANAEPSTITTDFILLFSMVALTLTTVFSCLTIGVINTGKEIGGIKYVIPLMIVAFLVFFAIRAVLLTFFSNLL